VKYPARCFSVLVLAALLIRLGNSCAYEADVAVFVQRSDPDTPYARYAAGRLGIIQPNYRIRHLVVAYNVLSGRGLTPAEQTSAVDVDNYYNAYATHTRDQQVSANGEPGLHWELGVRGVDHKVPGSDWETFTNCLSGAIVNANATLAAIRARYGKPGALDTPEIVDWIGGQDAVFSNCSDGGQMPQPAPANAPLWLLQDRAYQIAAAQFYALDYDAALTSFRAIADDHASPRSPLARYLVARVLIRKAVVPYQFVGSSQEQMEANNERVRGGLSEARDQLESILRDSAMKSLYTQALRLLDYVMLRLDPNAQKNELARRLTAARPGGNPDYVQNVIDLTYAYNSLPLYAARSAKKNNKTPSELASEEPLIRWIADVTGNAQPTVDGIAPNPDIRDAAMRSADALAVWHATHGSQWLVAALTTAPPGASDNAELLAAARARPPASAAWASVTYQRLRLATAPAVPAEQIPSTSQPVYAELALLMPRIAQSQPLSTINLFADLQSSLSPTLNDFLRNATRRPISLTDPLVDEPAPPPANPVNLCGVSVYDPATHHLDDETALIFNQRLPLRVLKEAALSPALPPNVRFEVAHMAWTRALLLGEPDIARALSPYLTGCQPAFADWLNQYNAARTPDERHVLGLLALMRFTSTEPIVRSGLERDFAAYDIMRDNWWCSASPPSPGIESPRDRVPYLFTEPITFRTQQPDPPFVTAQDRVQADDEIARLEKIPCASDYFAREALTWVKEHPVDPHDADMIGFAMRAVRNACRSKNTADLNHQLFDVLHRQFPKSDWSARYTTRE
jgi:hypothetical protein